MTLICHFDKTYEDDEKEKLKETKEYLKKIGLEYLIDKNSNFKTDEMICVILRHDMPLFKILEEKGIGVVNDNTKSNIFYKG